MSQKFKTSVFKRTLVKVMGTEDELSETFEADMDNEEADRWETKEIKLMGHTSD